MNIVSSIVAAPNLTPLRRVTGRSGRCVTASFAPGLSPIATFAAIALISLTAARATGANGTFEEPTPESLWMEEWNGPANHSDDAIAVLSLPDGSVLVVGRAYDPMPPSGDHAVLIRYDQAGSVLWTQIDPGFARPVGLHRTSTDDVLSSSYDFIEGQWHVVISRIDPSDGAIVWQTARRASLGFGLFKPAIAEDPDAQSVLVAAARDGQALVFRLALGDGAVIHEQLIDSSASGDDIATGIAPLPTGGFVVAVANGGLLDGCRVIAFDTTGDALWEDDEAGQIGNLFTRVWLGVDAQGNALVGAGMETTCGLFQFRAWKLSPTGHRLWTVEWPTGFCESAEPADFALAPDGSVAMVGQTHNPFDIAVLHVDPEGVMWTRDWNSPLGGVDDAVTVECDAGGNVIVGGFASASPGRDLALLAFTPEGEELFVRLDSVGTSSVESIRDLSVGGGDAAGTIAIVADGFTPPQNGNVFTGLYARSLAVGDLDADGTVGPSDLGILLGAWGGCGVLCPADLDGDGTVGSADLGTLLGAWGDARQSTR